MEGFDRDAFFDRVDVAGYFPHILSWAAKRRMDALRGKFPSLKKPASLNERKLRGLLTQTNEWKRQEIAESIIHHRAAGGEFGDSAINAERSGTLKDFVNNSDLFRSGTSDSSWDELVKQTLDDAGLEDTFQFFETDPILVATQYLIATDKAIANKIFVEGILDMFPMGREFATRFPPSQSDLIATELGYVRLSKVDHLQSVMKVKLPTGLRKYESYVTSRLANGDQPAEIINGLRDLGVGIDREIPEELIQAFKLKQVYVPEQVAEYLRWMNSADTFGATKFGQLSDGFHALFKALVTTAAHAHVGMNWSGNVFSMSQEIGLSALNPMNWLSGVKISMADAQAGKWADDIFKLGGEERTYREWRVRMNEKHVADVHAGSPFASEQLGAIEQYQRGTVRTRSGLAGQAAGAVAGGALGAATGIPFAMPAAGFLGAQVGSLLGEMGVMGWQAFKNEAVGDFLKAVESLSDSPKRSVLYGGKRISGAVVGATVGSTLGPVGTALGAVLGGMSFPAYVRVVTGLNQGVEASSRLTLAIGSMKKGNNIDEAVSSVNNALRDYGDLTPFEKRFYRRLFGFYTWDAGNMAFQLKWLMKNPMQAHAVSSVLGGMYRAEFTEQEAALLPEHLRWRILRPGLGLLFEWSFGDQHSLFYGKGWSQLTNARHVKNAPPLFRAALGLHTIEVPVIDKYGRKTGGTREEVRAENPVLWYLMQRLPGYRVLMEYNKIVTDTFMSRALDSGDPNAEATSLEKSMAFGFGARPYHIDFEGQARWVKFRLEQALLAAIKEQNPYAVTRYGTLRKEAFDGYRGEAN